ncbi:DsbC family protein [Sulfurirhabdus autotrophica]|uniref:Thiol:disulfide interchange protein n=1 Tax=Sulfurirhabdus autotrophica TaxID=1706046 RepID=A0A4V2W1M3_9PROT|nr:DsbC family protein [Sulfurirhabdus autotrophica]TCV84689.1 thiol:disulfide interchange protein DsbC [Sulfurirhabdus autotrophica]
MLKKIFAIALPVFLLACSAQADEAAIKKTMQERYGVEVQSITKIPIKGMYEIVVDGQILYADEKANYFIAGALVETKSKANLTEARMQDLLKVDFNTLPLDLAIKIVKGNGKRKLVVFSDPDCPFCRKLEKEMEGLNNVTIYTFLFPIASLHPNAGERAKAVWCSPDRAKAWTDLMLNGIEPKNVATCNTPLDKIAELGGKLKVNGTPALIFANGRRVPGALPASQIEKYLNEASAK